MWNSIKLLFLLQNRLNLLILSATVVLFSGNKITINCKSNKLILMFSWFFRHRFLRMNWNEIPVCQHRFLKIKWNEVYRVSEILCHLHFIMSTFCHFKFQLEKLLIHFMKNPNHRNISLLNSRSWIVVEMPEVNQY